MIVRRNGVDRRDLQVGKRGPLLLEEALESAGPGPWVGAGSWSTKFGVRISSNASRLPLKTASPKRSWRATTGGFEVCMSSTYPAWDRGTERASLCYVEYEHGLPLPTPMAGSVSSTHLVEAVPEVGPLVRVRDRHRHTTDVLQSLRPPSLRFEWQEELLDKFRLSFDIINAERVRRLGTRARRRGEHLRAHAACHRELRLARVPGMV